VKRAFNDAAYQPRYAIYTPSDGTAGAPDPFNPRVASLDDSGRLWFVTSRGVTVFDPTLVRQVRDRETLRPRIEGANDGARWFRARPDVTFAAGVRALRIDYALIVLSSFDQVRFRYRLDGVDAEWIDGTGRRQASYANLRPGSYRFRLQATNTATGDDAETTWAFAIAPAFYETRWFLAACLGAALLAILGLWRVRVGQVRRQLAAVHNERARLSREIHDTLLQSLAGVAMQLDAVSNDSHASPRIRIAMVRMRRQLEDYMRETRASIWNLRAGTRDDSDLVAALRTVAERVTSGRVRFTLSVSGKPRPCEPTVQAEVVRIVQEAVSNAVRHARAGQVRLTLGFGDTALRICVADDGRGFDPVAVGSSDGLHYGLVGIRERAEQIGARCSLESAPASGCEVVVELPLPRLTRRLVRWPA
jgi:signal transduction histidine kinase